MWTPILVAVLVALTGCSDGGDPRAEPGDQGKTEAPGAAIDVAGAPQSFYAVRDHRTEIVEVETATGRVLRTVVDVGPYRDPRADGGEEPNTFIDALDLAPDGRTLWYSAGTRYQHGSVFQLALPEGTPEEIAAGHGPSVSPDGRPTGSSSSAAGRSPTHHLICGHPRRRSSSTTPLPAPNANGSTSRSRPAHTTMTAAAPTISSPRRKATST